MTLPHQAFNTEGLEMVEPYLHTNTNNYSELQCHSLQIATEHQNIWDKLSSSQSLLQVYHFNLQKAIDTNYL